MDVGATTLDPTLLIRAEQLQYEGFQRRQETNRMVRQMADEGVSIRRIVRLTGLSRKLVRQILRGEREDVFRISSPGCRGSNRNGRADAATALRSGAVCASQGSGAACVWRMNRQRSAAGTDRATCPSRRPFPAVPSPDGEP